MNYKVSLRKADQRALHLWVLLAILATSAAASFAQSPSAAAGQGNPPAENAQGNPTATQSAKDDGAAKQEVSVRDTGTTFELRVNLVQVHVVVKDAKGKPVEGLKREDFQLYDQGKLQMISTFGVETPGTRLARAQAEAKAQQEASASPLGVLLPQRFVALVFDDIHLNVQDAMVVRASAKALIENLAETDRLAIYGTSGQVGQSLRPIKRR